jgi:hypothetical protein
MGLTPSIGWQKHTWLSPLVPKKSFETWRQQFIQCLSFYLIGIKVQQLNQRATIQVAANLLVLIGNSGVWTKKIKLIVSSCGFVVPQHRFKFSALRRTEFRRGNKHGQSRELPGLQLKTHYNQICSDPLVSSLAQNAGDRLMPTPWQ